jgi:hypothetical protein
MNLRKQSLAFLGILLFGTASFLGGCATTDTNRTIKTANSIYEVDDEVRKMIVQIDLTGTSLDILATAGQSDLKKSFDSYSENLDKLEIQGNRVLTHVDAMRAQSIKYFAEWEKVGDAYKHPHIQRMSEIRRSELAEIYLQVVVTGAGIKEAYLAYLTNLKGIRKELSKDLTPESVEAIAPITQKGVQDLSVLRESFKPAIAGLDEIKIELYLDIK